MSTTQADIDMENTRAIQANTEAIATLTEYFLENGALKFPQIMTNGKGEKFAVDLYADGSDAGIEINKVLENT